MLSVSVNDRVILLQDVVEQLPEERGIIIKIMEHGIKVVVDRQFRSSAHRDNGIRIVGWEQLVKEEITQ
jgi:hypothetical protein